MFAVGKLADIVGAELCCLPEGQVTRGTETTSRLLKRHSCFYINARAQVNYFDSVSESGSPK